MLISLHVSSELSWGSHQRHVHALHSNGEDSVPAEKRKIPPESLLLVFPPLLRSDGVQPLSDRGAPTATGSTTRSHESLSDRPQGKFCSCHMKHTLLLPHLQPVSTCLCDTRTGRERESEVCLGKHDNPLTHASVNIVLSVCKGRKQKVFSY